MRKINTLIIVGASGFIGNYLVEEALSQGMSVYALARKSSLDKMRIKEHSNLKIIDFDIDKLEELQDRLGICDNAACVNLFWAGVSGMQRGDYHVQLKNVEKSIELMEIMSSIGCKVFVGASSLSESEAEIYMQQDEVCAGQRFVYSISKLTTNYLSKVISQKSDIEFINAKIANVYGEYGLDDLLLHGTIIKLLKKEKTAFTAGEQLYDFLYVKDVARGLLYLAESGVKNTSYYLGSGKYRKLKDYLLYVNQVISPQNKLGLGEIPSDGISLPEYVFDTHKIHEHTGFEPKYEFEEAILDVIEWYKSKLEV